MQKKEKKKLSRREQRDLDIEIGFIERVVERDPHFVEALQILGVAHLSPSPFSSSCAGWVPQS